MIDTSRILPASAYERFSCSLHRFRIPLLVLLLLAGAAMPAAAQRLTLVSIDSADFPTIRARFYALDPSGTPITSLAQGDFTVTEDGTRREVLGLTCPPLRNPKAISSVLTIDVSGSMAYAGNGRAGDSNIRLARAAAMAWIEGLPEGESQCAISSFDDRSLILQDFTRDRDRLRAAVDRLRPHGGTDYNAGLVDRQAGGLAIAEGGTEKRVVIFLTDGRGGGNEGAIVAAAEKIGATIYCVTLNMPAPQVLKNIAARTGGACFENVTSVSEAENIYRAILYGAQGGEPCELSWRSEPGCASSRTVMIDAPARGLAAVATYTAPPRSVAMLEMNPPALSFGRVNPGDEQEMRITLTARNAPVTVRNIERMGRQNPLFTLSDIPVPFTLAPGESRSLVVRFDPADTNYAFARWNIASDACSGNSILASGGSGRGGTPTIRLLRPNGGERFRAGEETTLAWEGVLPADTVRLDYSTDNGASWRTVASRTAGLEHRWKVPATPSERCLARVTQIAGRLSKKAPARTFPGHTDYVLSFNFSPDGSRAVTASWDGTMRVWDVASGRQLHNFNVSGSRGSGRPVRAYYAEFSPDGSRLLAASDGNNVQIWDASGGGLLRTLQGRLYGKTDADHTMLDGASTPDPVFSADGSRVLLLTDNTPTIWDVSSGRKLHLLRGHTDWVNLAIFSPDGRRVLSVSKDQTARLWDAGTGAEIRRFTGHSADITNAAFSPDGTHIATVDWDDDVLIWNAETGEQLRRINAGKRTGGTIPRALFSPDGSSILVWAGIDAIPTLYNYRTGEKVHELAKIIGDHRFTATTVSFATFSSDGSLVAIVIGSDVELWDATTGEQIDEFEWDSQMSYAAFTPDGSHLATSMGRSMALWNSTSPALQTDRSDDLWAIVADSRPVAIDVDFGRRGVRSVTDSVVVGFIRNEGTGPLRVDDIIIEGTNAKDFTLVAGIPPFDVEPGRSHPVEFRFVPTNTGARTAAARIEAGGRSIVQRLRGEGMQPQLRLEAMTVDLGDVPVGDSRDSVVQVMLRNSGSAPVTVSSATLVGPDTAQFALVDGGGTFTVPPRGARAITLRFAPASGGRTSSRLAFSHDGGGSPLVAQLFGRGLGDEDAMGITYTDPTTFRSIAIPNAIVPAKGTIVTGVYDLLGVMAGYVPVDNLMVFGGGALPLPDDWGGVKGTMYGVYSIGAKWGFSPAEGWNGAVGYHWGESIFDEERTPDRTESRIRVNAPYAALSYGDDDSRFSATFGYALKRHVTIETTFDRDALFLGVGGDYRFANRWKVALEGLTMQTLGYIPVALAVRFFGERYAIDAGLGYLGITTPGGSAPSPAVVPVVSYVAIW